MKIKMTTCAVVGERSVYEFGREFIVGENIEKHIADSFVKANFAFIVKDDVNKEPEIENSKVEEPKIEELKEEEVKEEPVKPVRKRGGKKNEI